MTAIKPQLGEQVHYYDPNLVKKVGYVGGHSGRKTGPYLAFVTNDLGAGLGLLLCMPGYPPFPAEKVRSKDEVADQSKGEAYWDWRDPMQKARAAKRAAEAPPEPTAPTRDTTKHPSHA